jgi:predicted P-loop ATPase
MANDPLLKALCFNQLADGMEIKGDIPWKHPARFWRDADDAQLICYIDANYGTFSARNYQIAVAKVVDDRSYHPIREFLDSLPPWDGIGRAETILIDYLGAADNSYTRAVTRKTLCAAVARVKHPGIKFDNILVLNGDQGIGKSTLIEKLGGEWYSDSLSLTDMNDKTAAEKLQGYWILEIGELAGMKKADIDKVKAFISRQDDKYRASFGRRVTPHPRQCIFFGTTNSQNGYLRDITGNRRFWTVRTPGNGRLRPWELTKEEVEQIWSEALVLVARGEKLYLDSDLEALSQVEQSAAMEQDDREGLVNEYLDLPLPKNWGEMDIYARQEYVRDPNGPTQPKGTVERKSVSNMEIWCECFGKRKEDIKPFDSYAISAIMLRIPGWQKTEERETQPIYGRQRLYKRI